MANQSITLAFMNGWLAKHKSHPIRFTRRRHASAWVDEEGHPLPEAAGVPQAVILSLTCDQCHTGFAASIEPDVGQDIET